MKRINRIKNQSGVSMIIAVVFFLIMSLACLTLFHVASGAVMEAKSYADSQKADILAASMSTVVQDLIENGYKIKEGLESTDRKIGIDGIAETDGRELITAGNAISKYIYDNLENKWQYYYAENAQHNDLDALTKTLTLEGLEGQGARGELKMYWTWDEESCIKHQFATRKLYITVTIYVGDEKASVRSIFTSDEGKDYKYSDLPEESENQYFWWKYNGGMG